MIDESMDIDQVARRLLECIPTFTADEQVVALSLYRQLARGEPVDERQLANDLGYAVDAIGEILQRPHLTSLTYRDDTGIVGFGGLAFRPMHHRLTVAGRELYAWCAWDSLFIPPILGEQADISSPCPTTGTIVRIRLGPDGVDAIEPGISVMSFLAPDASAFEGDVQRTMSSFCHFVYFFASRDAAAPWLEEHPGTMVMSIHDGFRLGELLNETRWGIGRSGP